MPEDINGEQHSYQDENETVAPCDSIVDAHFQATTYTNTRAIVLEKITKSSENRAIMMIYGIMERKILP